MHKDIIKLLDYLKGRKEIFTEFYTNASLHERSFWKELNRHFNEKSQVYFTICGTTQELHSKYRVGSNLDKVIENAIAFKDGNPNKNDYMQYIRFEYNKHDPINRINKILGIFSDCEIIDTDPIYERLNIKGNDRSDGICSEKVFSFLYKRRLLDTILKKNRKIQCYSFENKYIRIDSDMTVFPCVCYKIYCDKNFCTKGKMDYSEILQNKYDFCLECDMEMTDFLHKNHRDAFYMC